MNDSSKNLQKILDQINEFPTLPSVVHKINKMLQNPKTSADEVGKAIVTDQAIASKVIKLVNSAFYGFPGKINTITHAIVILGFATVKNIVLTTSIIHTFGSDSDHKDFDLKEFWKHAISTGTLSKVIAREAKYKNLEQAFIAGLLHDVGKLVLHLFAREEFDKAFQYAQKSGLLLREAEQRILGFDHSHVGAWLAEKWNMPQDLSAVIQHHHSPQDAGIYQNLCSIVNFADILARGLELGTGGDQSIPNLENFIWEDLKLSESQIKKILKNSVAELEKAAVFQSIL